MSSMQSDIEVRNSNGRSNKIVRFVRPTMDCFNRSRRITGFTPSEVNQKVENCIRKWYAPIVIRYFVDGKIIGSNSKENALKEYWRVCALEDCNKLFEVFRLSEHQTHNT